MSPKKKKRPGTAQQLIDSLLDDRTPAPHIENRDRGDHSQSVRLVSEADSAPRERVFHSPDTFSKSLSLEGEKTPQAKDPVSNSNAEVSFDLKPQSSQLPPATQAAVTNMTSSKSANKATRSVGDAVATYSKHQGDHNEVTVTVPGAGIDSVNAVDVAGLSENTVRLDGKRRSASTSATGNDRHQSQASPRLGHGGKSDEPSIVDRAGLTELKTVVRMRDRNDPRTANSGPEARSRSSSSAAGGFSSAEAQLKQSESLRIAQTRMTELETELERLRRENERLASAGETLSRRADELVARTENLDLSSKEAARIHEEERRVFRGQIQSKDRENAEMRARLEEMESRLENNFKKIRVRERELEHRLEIVRMESATLVSTKDKMLLDLKRQIDQLTHESDYSKQKSQELYNQYKEKQETARRVVRALRIALTILEGEEDTTGKKPE